MTRAALAAVFLLGASATAAHADARLDAFRSACIPHRTDYEATRLAAKQDGWVEVAMDDDPELAATLDLLRKENDPQGLAILTPLRKDVEGRVLYLVAASFPQEQSLVTSCLLFDFGSNEPIDPDLVGKWLNAPPDEVLDAPADGSVAAWRDAEALPDATVKATFVPDGGPAIPLSGFSGVLLRIDSVAQ